MSIFIVIIRLIIAEITEMELYFVLLILIYSNGYSYFYSLLNVMHGFKKYPPHLQILQWSDIVMSFILFYLKTLEFMVFYCSLFYFILIVDFWGILVTLKLLMVFSIRVEMELTKLLRWCWWAVVLKVVRCGVVHICREVHFYQFTITIFTSHYG